MAISPLPERRTSADVVFDGLYEQISSLALLPGARISESEIAAQFGVSRQPVRDAFNRLENMELLLVQPQKATLVKKFSLSAIDSARFIRLAIEIEIAREAIKYWDEGRVTAFESVLEQQEIACKAEDHAQFHRLDEAFHRLTYEVSGRMSAFGLAMTKKAQIDRICVLSLKEKQEMTALVDDHKKIYQAMKSGNLKGLEKVTRLHLSRIEKTIEKIRVSHAEYFSE